MEVLTWDDPGALMSRKSVLIIRDGGESKLFEQMPHIDTQRPCFKIKTNEGHVHMQVYSEKRHQEFRTTDG